MFIKLSKRNKYNSKTWFPIIGTCNNVPLDKGSTCKQKMTVISVNPHTASLLRRPLDLISSSLLILYSAWWVKWLQVCRVHHCALQGGFTLFFKWCRTNCNQTDHFSIHQHDMICLPTETNLWMEVNQCISSFFFPFVLFHSFMLFDLKLYKNICSCSAIFDSAEFGKKSLFIAGKQLLSVWDVLCASLLWVTAHVESHNKVFTCTGTSFTTASKVPVCYGIRLRCLMWEEHES